MGFGSPPPEDQKKTLNAILFFLAMLALWTIAHAVLAGWLLAILFGVFYGYPMTAVVGFLEYLSSRITTGLLARLLFALLAAGAFYAFVYFSTKTKISEHPDMWYLYFQLNLGQLGPGTLLVVLGYLVHGFRRDRVAKQLQAA